MLFGLKGERINVNTHSRDVGVVLVRLNQVEVVTITNLEAVMAVKLKKSGNNRVLTSHAFNTGDGVTRLENATVPPVRVVEGLLSLPGVDDVVVTRDEGVTLDDPDQFLAGVVEVKLQLVGRGGARLATSELEDIDEVFVGNLGEFTSFIRVEVDVVNVERGSGQTALADTSTNGVGVSSRVRIVPAQVVEGVEFQIDTNFVVLKSDQGERKTRVAAEPELEGNVQGVHGST